jgi:hypothetical protein
MAPKALVFLKSIQAGRKSRADIVAYMRDMDELYPGIVWRREADRLASMPVFRRVKIAQREYTEVLANERTLLTPKNIEARRLLGMITDPTDAPLVEVPF